MKVSRSTPHQRAMANSESPPMHIYGGLQLFVDLNRAFDGVDRAKLFARLPQLCISAPLVQLLSAWHEGTHYHIQTDNGYHSIETGKGVRQGCKAAPSLFNFFLVLFLQEVCQVLPIEWVQSHLTAYADDCHIGGVYKNVQDFEFLRMAFGILFSTLRSMDLQVNPEKSVAILAMAGSAHRRYRGTVVHRDQHGEKIRIDVPGADPVFIPLHRKTKYLGVIVSYGRFEDDCLLHRNKLMHVGFQRLKRWLTGRHAFDCFHRFRLWRSCILPILTYGIFAVGFSSRSLQPVLTSMTVMLRKLIGDHSFLTGHTNREALLQHNIPSPAVLLLGAAIQLQQSVTQRCSSLQSYDIVWSVDWSHLPALVRQLELVQASESLERSSFATREVTLTGKKIQCALCGFETPHLSVFRRHCTQLHGQGMYRTQFSSAIHFFVDGLPQCKFCGLAFTSWRSFTTHIERGCQVLLRGPALCLKPLDRLGQDALCSLANSMQVAGDVATRSGRLLAPAELAHVQGLPFGNRLLCLIQDSDWHLVKHEHEACAFLRQQCILCGFRYSRTQELHAHYRQAHPDRWELAPQKGIQLTNLHATENPCEFCGSLFRTHQCVVWSQVAVLLVNGAHHLVLDDSMPPVLPRHRCEICLENFDSVASLTQHLQAQHGLQGLAFNASRDAIADSPACAHCGHLFQTMPGLKTHIVQGKCPEFDPQALAETQPVDQLWRDACVGGKLSDVLRSPLNRMRLTVRCQMCGKGCQRASDLALHLQTAHPRLWKASQRLQAVLVDVFYTEGQCICNPKSGIKRSNHVCLPYRQLAMSFLRMGQEPFAPMLITDILLSCTLTPKIAADVRFHLDLVLSQRNFAALWQDEPLLRWMRTHCIFCGALHTAADLAIHVREAHIKGQNTMLFYMEQLMPVITALQPVDHQCALCMQIYNLPVALSPLHSTDTRASVAQSHLKGCCPNLLQVALLLARLLHGSGLPYGPAGRDGTDAGAGNVSGHCPPVGQVPETGIESQGQQAPAKKRLKRSRHSQGRGLRVRSTAGAPSETLGAADRSSRSRTQQSSQDGSIHHFFGSRTDRGSAASSAILGSMEAADGVLDASAGLDASAPVSGPRTAEGSPETLESADGMPGHGPIVSDLSLEGGDSPGSQFPLPSLGCNGQETDLGQEEVGAGGQDGSTHRRAPGDDDRWPSHSEISCIEAAVGAGCPDHSVAPPAPHTVGQTVRADAAVGVQLHLDVGGGLHEATHTGTEPVGDHVAETPLSEAGQGKGPRQGED